MVKSIKQFEVWLVQFDPAVGSEIKKSRPAVVVSNNIINDLYATVIVAPLTSAIRDYPTRIDTNFDEKGGQIAVDQLKCFDKVRLKKKIGAIAKAECDDFLEMLSYIFQPE
ncbi:MAG: type II toxin-antitoxin system PemK/MazF family toxin [Bacteroidetes bacterium]|nr:type II toxin-antitoxin system PemK/MazF family toxin [Bacteroidota bacterium]